MLRRALVVLLLLLLSGNVVFAQGTEESDPFLAPEDVVRVDIISAEEFYGQETGLMGPSSIAQWIHSLQETVQRPIMPGRENYFRHWLRQFNLVVELFRSLVSNLSKIIGEEEVIEDMKIHLPEIKFLDLTTMVIDNVALKNADKQSDLVLQLTREVISYALPVSAEDFPDKNIANIIIETSTSIAVTLMVISLMANVLLWMVYQTVDNSFGVSTILGNFVRWLMLFMLSLNGLLIFYSANGVFNFFANAVCPSLSCFNFDNGLDYLIRGQNDDLTEALVKEGSRFIYGVGLSLSFASRVALLNVLLFLTPIAIASLTLLNGEMVFQEWLSGYTKIVLGYIATALMLKFFADNLKYAADLGGLFRSAVAVAVASIMLLVNLAVILSSGLSAGRMIIKTTKGIFATMEHYVQSFSSVPSVVIHSVKSGINRMSSKSYRFPFRPYPGIEYEEVPYGYFGRKRKR